MQLLSATSQGDFASRGTLRCARRFTHDAIAQTSAQFLPNAGWPKVVQDRFALDEVPLCCAFYPANRRAFEDRRSHVVIDDAKSYFASARQRYDLIMSEPSNPWVSGVSGLFTTEFYSRVRQYMTDDGVFGQWLHVYELDDGLVLSVLAALHQNFRSYEIYLVPGSDLLVVASNRPSVPAPDWSVAGLAGLRGDLCRFLPLTPTALDALHLIGRAELAPLLDTWEQPNSDFYPVLDLGAERRRFRRDMAGGFNGLSADWFNLVASIRKHRVGPMHEQQMALPQNPRLRARVLGAFLRTPSAELVTDQARDPEFRLPAFQWQRWQMSIAADQTPASWDIWVDDAGAIYRLRNEGDAGTLDDTLYNETMRFMDRHNAPAPVRDVMLFRHALGAWDFATAAATADRLAPLVLKERRWITGDELRDGAVIAKLQIGDVAAARRLYDALAPLSRRAPGDLRSQLLQAYVRATPATSATPSPRPAPRTG